MTYKELPSGKILSIDDIIYIGNCVKNKDNYWEFSVLWANRAQEKMKYCGFNECEADRNTLTEAIFKDLQPVSDMICD